MKLPNWFKIIWWVFLLALISYVVFKRHNAIVTGTATPGDFVIVFIWIAVFLAPLFQEVEIFGLRFKQHIDELKGEITSLRTAVRSSIDVQTHISIPAPPPDQELPLIEERVRRIVGDTLRDYGVTPPTAAPQIDVPQNALSLFRARYQIEREIIRIWEQRMSSEMFSRPRSAIRMAVDLANEGFIDHRLISAIRDVYSVASPAIHGREITEAQSNFVADLAPSLIAALRAIQ